MGSLALAALLCLGGCGVASPDRPSAGRVQMSQTLNWQDLGGADELLADPATGGVSVALPTRAIGLRSPDQELLAVVVVQGNRTGLPGDMLHGVNVCPEQNGVAVEDRALNSPARIDCLRFRRWGDGDDWLARNAPALGGYLERIRGLPAKPYEYVSFRFNSEAGMYVSIQAVVNRKLLEPSVRSTQEFLTGGRPAMQWAKDLAQAARVSASMLDGQLALPPFPMPLPN
jgi:hypothetical protein